KMERDSQSHFALFPTPLNASGLTKMTTGDGRLVRRPAWSIPPQEDGHPRRNPATFFTRFRPCPAPAPTRGPRVGVAGAAGARRGAAAQAVPAPPGPDVVLVGPRRGDQAIIHAGDNATEEDAEQAIAVAEQIVRIMGEV